MVKIIIQKHGWDMSETSIMDNYNCKTQVHARVCEENKLKELKLEKNDTFWINFAVKGPSLKDHIRRVERGIKIIFSRMIHHSIKVLVTDLGSITLVFVFNWN